MSNFYLITVSNNYSLDVVSFHNYIVSLYPGYFSAWWHYIQGSTYIIYSTLNENEIYNLLRLNVQGNNFLVIKVDPRTAQGWLPREAWTWLGR